MIENSFFSNAELSQIGFKSVGNNVFISRFARFYDVENIEIGNNVRIDDFCILSGKIKLNNYIHISAYCALYGKYGIEMADYTGLSPRCTIFSASDDFSGEYLIGPVIDPKYTNVEGGSIIINKFSQIGSGCIILPGVIISEGVAVGAMSFINKNLDEWQIYKGIPAKAHAKRSKELLKFISI